MIVVDGFAVFAEVVVLLATFLVLLLAVELPEAGGPRGPGVLRPDAVVGHRHDADGLRENRPHHDLPVARDPLDRARTCSPRSTESGSTSQEAGLKYFLLGSFSSAVFLYGIALVYGAHRHDEPHRHRPVPRRRRRSLHDGVLLVGIALLLVGLGFKVAAAPFHMWAPDVYQGAPTPVTTFMAAATKAAGSRRCCGSSSARSSCTTSTGGRPCSASRWLSLGRRECRRRRPDRREAHARLLGRSRTRATC